MIHEQSPCLAAPAESRQDAKLVAGRLRTGTITSHARVTKLEVHSSLAVVTQGPAARESTLALCGCSVRLFNVSRFAIDE